MPPTDAHQKAAADLLQSIVASSEILALLQEQGRQIVAMRGELAELRGFGKSVGTAPKKWLKLKEAAEVLSASPKTVRRYIDRGFLKRNGASRHILIPAEDVENFRKKVAL